LGENNAVAIEFPEKYRKNIKLRYAMKNEYGYYILPFKAIPGYVLLLIPEIHLKRRQRAYLKYRMQ